MRICDRCGSKVCSERWKNFRMENEVDFCESCNNAFLTWMTDFALMREEKPQATDELTRKRGRPPKNKED